MNDFALLSKLTAAFQAEVSSIVMRESRRHMMDMHLDFETLALVEEELVPALQAVMDSLEWEPSDEDLLGEPVVSADERHTAAHAEHVKYHS
jgi:hypothetical protein